MAAAGDEGLVFLDALYGRREPAPPSEPWTCSACDAPQLNRLPHTLNGKPVCGSCHWAGHEREASE